MDMPVDQEHATTGQAGDAPEAGPRVLVVADNATERLVLTRQLDRLGVAATVIGDGTEAVEAVRQGRFDAVLMDRHLPGVDGLEATRRIRHLPGGRDLPVIAMTADTRPEHRRECLDAGVDDYLAKPLEMASLRETLWRWLPSPTKRRRGSTPPSAGLDLDLQPAHAAQVEPDAARGAAEAQQRLVAAGAA